MKDRFRAFILQLLGVNQAIAKHNEQVEEYVDNSVSDLESTLRNELADHGQIGYLERSIEGLQSQINQLVND